MEPEPKLHALVGYRIVRGRHGNEIKEWLICNGMNMGRWTSFFGANCLADIFDCKEFLKNSKSQYPDLVIVEYEVAPVHENLAR